MKKTGKSSRLFYYIIGNLSINLTPFCMICEGGLNCRIKFHPYMEFNPANLLPLNSGI